MYTLCTAPERCQPDKLDLVFQQGGAQPHSIAFGGVFHNITEANLNDDNSTKSQNLPSKSGLTKSGKLVRLTPLWGSVIGVLCSTDTTF